MQTLGSVVTVWRKCIWCQNIVSRNKVFWKGIIICVLWCLWYCGSHQLYKVHLVRLVHFVIENIDLLMCFYFIIDTQQTIQWWCDGAIIEFHCLPNTILLNNDSSLCWPALTADWAKVTSNVVISLGNNNNNNDRVQTNKASRPYKNRGSVSTD